MLVLHGIAVQPVAEIGNEKDGGVMVKRQFCGKGGEELWGQSICEGYREGWLMLIDTSPFYPGIMT